MKKQDDYLNNYKDSDSTAHYGAVGGNYKKWKLEIENLSKKLGIDQYGKNMGEIQDVIHKFNRLDCPLILKPHESTFLDVGIWAYLEEFTKPGQIIDVIVVRNNQTIILPVELGKRPPPLN
jgi:hypothetical protein